MARITQTAKATELQIRHTCPFIPARECSGLVEQIASNTKQIEFTNESFQKDIVHESYTDILQDDELQAIVAALSGAKPPIDLTRLPGVDANQLQVSHTGPVKNAVDVVLRIAEVNLAILMAASFRDSDLFAPDGAERLLRSKLGRIGVSPPNLDKFYSLLDLNDIRDIGAPIAVGEITFAEVLKLRKKRHSRKFRKWLRSANPNDARELERLYVASLGRRSFADSLPMKTARFAITTAAGALDPLIGAVVGVADNFFVDKWLQGYSPKLFLDRLQSLTGGKTVSSASDDNKDA